MKGVDREGGEAKKQENKDESNPNDPFFQLGDRHRL